MLVIFSSHAFMHWLERLGGPGLMLLAQVDNSPIPVPGSMDVLTILLASARKDLWWYYALMATVGAVSAGYFSYRVGRKGGKEMLDKKLGEKRAKKVDSIFGHYGFWSVFIGAILPPPVPLSPVLLTAGVLKYPVKKYLAALTLGRAVRYTALAYLGSIYGHSIIHWAKHYYRPVLYGVIGLGVAAGLVALFYWRRYKKNEKPGTDKPDNEPKHLAA